MTDVINGAKAGSAEALNKIYESYKRQIYYFCLKLVDDVETAGDLCCETFSCAFERLDTLEDAGQFEIWIKNIAAIRCYNYIHKMKPMLFLQAVGDTEEPLFGEKEIAAMPKGEVDELKTAALIDEMLNRLNDAQRMTLMLHYYNNLSVGQIAKIMSCDPQIVKQRMSKAAEHIKNTIAALKNSGIDPTPVEFCNALQITAACTDVPASLEIKVHNVIDSFTCEIVEPAAPADDTVSDSEYILEHYINVDRTVGTMEEAANKFVGEEKKEYDTGRFAAFENHNSAEVKHETAENPINTDKVKPVPTARKTALQRRDKKPKSIEKIKNITAIQRIAALGVVAVIVIIVAAVGLSNSSSNKTVSSKASTSSAKKASSGASSSTAANKTAVTKAEITFSDNENTLKATDGTTIAKVSYKLPVVTLGDSAAAEKINSVFKSESETVLGSYSSDERKAECEYAYSSKPYGDFSPYLNEVTAEAGIADTKTVNIKTVANTFLYGNVHGDTAAVGYCFSVLTGERLAAADVFSDVDAYVSAAGEYIKEKLEQKQAAGECTLLQNYESSVRTLVTSVGKWYLTDGGVTVLFNDEDVAAYGTGVIEITVPYENIKSFIKGEYAPE